MAAPYLFTRGRMDAAAHSGYRQNFDSAEEWRVAMELADKFEVKGLFYRASRMRLNIDGALFKKASALPKPTPAQKVDKPFLKRKIDYPEGAK